MAFTAPPTSVPNDPQDLAKNLRFIGSNGILVTRQFPWDYQNTIGGTLSHQIDIVNTVISELTVTNNNITNLQTQITSILTSGAFVIPKVASGCLSSSATLPMDTVVGLLVTDHCAYNSVLGPTSNLYQSISSQGSNLNIAPAFGQNSAMSGIAGWKSLPLTIGDTINNEWLTLLDARAGITRALAGVTPTCAQVIVDASVTLPLFGTGFDIYFDGYTFIPTGYVDNGSTIKIVDSNFNVAINGINIITQSTTNQPYNFVTSGTTLEDFQSYDVYINSSVTNPSLGITCQKSVIKHLVCGACGPILVSPNACCPDIGNVSFAVSSGCAEFPHNIVAGLSYTPRFVQIIAKNTYTSIVILNHNYSITYTLGGFIVNISVCGATAGTANFDWIAFR